jgi:hypothetical protein
MRLVKSPIAVLPITIPMSRTAARNRHMLLPHPDKR